MPAQVEAWQLHKAEEAWQVKAWHIILGSYSLATETLCLEPQLFA